jgi:hypothetical protein
MTHSETKHKKQHDKHKTRNNKAKSAKTAAQLRPPRARHRGPQLDFKKNDICSEPLNAPNMRKDISVERKTKCDAEKAKGT